MYNRGSFPFGNKYLGVFVLNGLMKSFFYPFQLQSNGYIDHLALELYQGSLVATMNVGSESLAATASSNLNDGVPHEATITLVGTQLTLTIDGGSCTEGPCSVSVSPSVAGGPLELNEALYVGGIGPDASPYIISKLLTVDSFIGCIQVHIHVHAIDKDFENNNIQSRAVVFQLIQKLVILPPKPVGFWLIYTKL